MLTACTIISQPAGSQPASQVNIIMMRWTCLTVHARCLLCKLAQVQPVHASVHKCSLLNLCWKDTAAQHSTHIPVLE
jgi:hypothetical protein